MKNSISSRSNFEKIIDKTDQELYRFKIQDKKQNRKEQAQWIESAEDYIRETSHINESWASTENQELGWQTGNRPRRT